MKRIAFVELQAAAGNKGAIVMAASHPRVSRCSPGSASGGSGDTAGTGSGEAAAACRGTGHVWGTASSCAVTVRVSQTAWMSMLLLLEARQPCDGASDKTATVMHASSDTWTWQALGRVVPSLPTSRHATSSRCCGAANLCRPRPVQRLWRPSELTHEGSCEWRAMDRHFGFRPDTRHPYVPPGSSWTGHPSSESIHVSG